MSDPVFKISRTFDAPLTLVWDMYSKKEHLTRWWGPKGFEWVGGTLDFRPGGIFHYGMKSPAGGTTRAPFAANFPLEVLNTVQFSEKDGKTTLAMTGTPFNAGDNDKAFFESMFPSMNQGFTGTLNQLEDYLASQK